MKIWDKKTILNFHKNYEGDFAGDVVSSEIVRLSRRYIGEKILDIGAGSGALIDQIPKAIGLDLAPKHPNVIAGDISELSFKDEIFDTVFTTEILEHLDGETLNRGLREIYRILRVGGYLIITIPNNENLKHNTIRCPKCGVEFHRWGHMQVFDEKRISEDLKGHGFDIVELKCLPLGFMAKHKFLKLFRYFLERFGLISSGNLFVVAEKTR